MGKAIIVFADGSKQMAHNLDDGRFRWHERKLFEARGVEEHFEGRVVVRDCSQPDNVDQAEKWQQELTLQRAALEQACSVMHRAYPDRSDYERAARHLRMGISEVNAQQTVVRGWIKDNITPEYRIESIRKILDERREQLIAAQAEIIRLQRILIEQFNVPESIVYRKGKDSDGGTS